MDCDLKIINYPYSQEGLEKIKSIKNVNWPYVYLIHDNKKMYIGETQNIYKRTKQHLDKDDVDVSFNSNIKTIYDCSLNKSAILDIEKSLIRLFETEGQFELLNIQPGQSPLHNYYQKDYYHNELTERIWNELLNLKLVNNPLSVIKNFDIFKFSPYVSITTEQLDVSTEILEHINDSLRNNSTGTYVVRGGAGTGKTVLAIYLLRVLMECFKNQPDTQDVEDYDEDLTEFNLKRTLLTQTFISKNVKKIGFVVPMTSLRNTLKNVFRKLKMKDIKVIGPYDVVKDEYDILFVDEAHRLFHCKNIQTVKAYKNVCKQLNKNPSETTQADWVMLRSKYCVLFYDENQTVKKSDITKEEFNKALKIHDFLKGGLLTSQLRCAGGTSYTDYVDEIMLCKSPKKKNILSYETKVYDKIGELVNIIHEKQKTDDLCFLTAGYGFKWISKKLSYDKAKELEKYDIVIDDVKLIWNTTPYGWIYSEHAKDEVGCIHTTQGYDLNYCGVIFGPDIDYDPISNKMIIHKNKFYDTNVKKSATEDELKKFIINAYSVLLKRGIRGTFIYCVNKNLREYFKKYFNQE